MLFSLKHDQLNWQLLFLKVKGTNVS